MESDGIATEAATALALRAAARDFENRQLRGRTYGRNGSVIDLKRAAGTVT